MSIYVISNRPVKIVNNKERFKNSGNFQVPYLEKTEDIINSFRIAKCYVNNVDTDYDIIDDKNEFQTDSNAFFASSEDATYWNGSYTMMKDITKELRAGEDCDILIFTHGAAHTFDKNRRYIYQLRNRYLTGNFWDRRTDWKDFQTPIKHMIFFSYPTALTAFDYRDDAEDALNTGKNLGNIYSRIQENLSFLLKEAEKKNCKLNFHLMVASLGNRVLANTIAQAILKANEADKNFKFKKVFKEIILIHPEIDNDVFEPFLPYSYLQDIGDRIHIYLNSRGDLVLGVARWLNQCVPRLGQTGPTPNSGQEAFIVDVDTDNSRGRGLKEALFQHWSYLKRPTTMKDILAVFRGKKVENISTRVQSSSQKNYFFIKRTQR